MKQLKEGRREEGPILAHSLIMAEKAWWKECEEVSACRSGSTE